MNTNKLVGGILLAVGAATALFGIVRLNSLESQLARILHRTDFIAVAGIVFGGLAAIVGIVVLSRKGPLGTGAAVAILAGALVAAAVVVLSVSFGKTIAEAGRDTVWMTEQARRDVNTIAANGVDAFRVMKGRYPSEQEGLRLLLTEGFLRPNSAAGTLVDPWGSEYVYRHPGIAHPDSFDVVSYGADAAPGGDGPAEDIVNY